MQMKTKVQVLPVYQEMIVAYEMLFGSFFSPEEEPMEVVEPTQSLPSFHHYYQTSLLLVYDPAVTK